MRPTTVPAAVAGLLLLAAPAAAQQVADTTYDTRVERPAFTARHPRVRIDEAHSNFHTADGRYRVLADLLRNDGCRVDRGTMPFSAAALEGCDVLVISNALGAEHMASPLAERPAFTDAECDAVRDWVSGGGALLLIADHAPMGAAARPLAERFGVNMRNSYAFDSTRSPGGNRGLIEFRPGAGLPADHPIALGRDSTERLGLVVSFTGQTLAGPPGSAAILEMSDHAVDQLVGFGQAGRGVPPERLRPAAGRAQGVAFEFGRGRVVVLGEAAMLSAWLAGPRGARMGMNMPGIDNRQFALSVVRWLTRAL